MFGDDAPRAATALASVQARRTPQSTNPDAVRAALDECRAWLANPNANDRIPRIRSTGWDLGFGIWDSFVRLPTAYTFPHPT